MGQTDLRRLVIAQGAHIRIAVRNMSQVPDTELSSNIVKQSEDIRGIRVKTAAGRGYFFRAMGGNPAVIAPWTGVAKLGFFQKLSASSLVGIIGIFPPSEFPCSIVSVLRILVRKAETNLLQNMLASCIANQCFRINQFHPQKPKSIL